MRQRGHDVRRARARQTRAPPSRGCVRSGGRRHPVQRDRTRRSTRGRGPSGASAPSSARSGPTSSTSTSRSRRARRCGRRSRRRRPWWPRSTPGAVRSRLYDLAAPLIRRIARRIVGARRGVARGRARRAPRGSAGRSRSCRTAWTSARFADAEPADLGAGTKLLFVGRLDERKGFPVAVAAFGRLAADRPDAPPGRGRRRSASEAATDVLAPDVRARVTMLGAVPNVELPAVRRGVRRLPGPVDRRRELRHRAGGGDGGGAAGRRERHPRLRRGGDRRGGGAPGPAARPGGARGRGRRRSWTIRRWRSGFAAAGRARADAFDWSRGGRAARGRSTGRPSPPARYDRPRCSPSGSSSRWSSSCCSGPCSTFNRLVTLRNRVENGWSQIDVQLRRRYDLIPNLSRR